MDANCSTFSRLKPLCVNFLRDCSIKNIRIIKSVVMDLNFDSLEQLQELVTLPFIAHLNTKLSEKITIECIDFLTLVFKKSKLKSFSNFKNVFVLMMSKMSNLQDINKVNNISEELKLSICENMLHLVQCSSEEVLNEMFSLTFRPHLAHAFFVFNILLREEKSRTLLKAILNTISGFAYIDDYVGNKYEKTVIIASESLASCLPGLSIALQNIACGNDKQAHNIIIMAVRMLSKLITLIVGDESYNRNITSNTSSEIYRICYTLNTHDESDSNTDIPIVFKDKAWFKTVSEKLVIILQNITNLSIHKHCKVRLEILNCSKLLLFSCLKTLGNCVHVLLPPVFELTVDENEVVSLNARDIILSISEKLGNENDSTLNSVIHQNIDKLISYLIKKKFSLNDNKKLSTLKCLLGYIRIAGSTLNDLLFVMPQLEKIVLALITLLEFDISELNLVEEMPLIESTEITCVLWPKKIFKFFENEEILFVICKICCSLGSLGNSRFLIDYLLEKISSNNLYTLQCIFIIGSIIKGLSNEPNTSINYSMLVGDILEIFLSNSFFDIQISNNNFFIQKQSCFSERENLPPVVLNKNNIQICLLLEAIANCSSCLKADFKLHLLKALCPVMEKAGSSNFIISQCGQICLYQIAMSCEYKSVQELIKDNADYITNMMIVNFHQYLHKPEIAIVLKVAMEQSDAEALILFRDLIFQILDYLDYNQDAAYPLLSVLLSVVISIKKWFPSQKNCLLNDISVNCAKKGLKTLVKEYISLKETVSNIESENFNSEFTNCEDLNENLSNTENDYNVDENKSDVPLHVTITCEIFKRCIHLQSSENQFVRMLTLEMVEICILVLHNYENNLHPLIHEFWNPFLRRFKEGTFISKAFNVLLTIANECGDFVRSRTSRDVIPNLCLFLKKEFSNSLQSFRQYQWTNEHSLQILVLSEIGNLCTKLDICEKDFNSVVNVCLPYLHKKQPMILQEGALKSLQTLATIDPDSIWFYWNVSFCEKITLLHPHKRFLKIHFPYSDNSLTSMNISI